MEPKTMEKRLHRVIGRPLDLEESTWDLAQVVADLRAEPILDREGIDSIILHKEESVKAVVIAMRAGAKIEKHRASAPITVQVLDGSIRFSTADGAVELRAGRLLTLHADVEHAVEALADCAFLLTLSGRRER